LINSKSLKKTEILRNKFQINTLFSEGKGFNIYPIRVFWIENKDNSCVDAMVVFSVPKRIFKRAVDRNKLKRRMREAYRLNKTILIPELQMKNKKVCFMLSYIGKEIMDYTEIESKVSRALKRIADDF
jgi:ribonuclease P protein component